MVDILSNSIKLMEKGNRLYVVMEMENFVSASTSTLCNQCGMIKYNDDFLTQMFARPSE